MKPVAASAGHGLVRRFISLALATGLAIGTAFTMAPAVGALSARYVSLSPTASGGGSCAAPDYNTIQGAVDAAGTGATVHICAGTYSLAATITVSKDLTLVGDGAGSTIVDGTNAVQIVNVIGSITVSALTFQNGVGHYLNGGAIGATGDVTVTNSTFSGNESSTWSGGSSSRGGGAIYANGTVSVTNSTFSNNACGGLGGGAINANGAGSTGSIVSVTNSTFSGNQASGVGGLGGAIYAQGDGTVSVTNSTFSSNSALIGGGAIYANVGGAVTVTNSTFSNQTSSYGGAIYANGTLSVTNSTFSNQTSSYGGAIYANVGGAVTVTNSTFSGNSADLGGAISAYDAVTVTNSTFSGNQASGVDGVGGAIGAIGATGTVTVTNSTFSSNQASGVGGLGGAISATSVTVTNSTFSGNDASGQNGGGGAISAYDAVTVTNSTFSGNQASGVDGVGGAIGAIGATGTVTVTNSTFSSNSADLGGAIYADGTVTVTNSTFSGNDASGVGVGGGAIRVAISAIVTNSILAGTTNNCSGSITDGGGNFSTDTSCGFIESSSHNGVDLATLHLHVLANNGGPTQTIALLAGSVAIDAGLDSVCAAGTLVNGFDQRGVVRPQGAHCDAGAYEVTAGAASKLAFTTQPGGDTGGTSWSSQPVVTVEDAADNPVTSVASITLAITTPGGATLACTGNPVTASGGVATFAGCNIDKAGTGYTLTATATGLASGMSGTFDITAAGLDHITLSPSSATIAAGASQTYTAAGFDADDNSWDATSSITFTIDGGGSCDGALCTATVAGDHIVTGTDTVGGTIHATATLHVDAAGATPTPTPMATPTPTPSRAATPPPTSTGVGPASDGPAGTILFLPVALVAFFGSLLLLVIRQRRRVF